MGSRRGANDGTQGESVDGRALGDAEAISTNHVRSTLRQRVRRGASMIRKRFTHLSPLSPWFALAALASCSVDQRPLTFEYRALDVAGSISSAGTSAAGNGVSGAGSSVSGRPDAADAGACSNCGGNGDAGAPNEVSPNEASGEGGKGSGGSAGIEAAGNAGAPSGAGAGGAAAEAGSAGHAGSAPQFPCADLNQDAVDDCQQTLVRNSRFDASASDWELEPSTTQTWDASDSSGKQGSGSLQVGNVLPAIQANGSVLAGTRQCVPVTPMTNYDFAARVLIGPGQAIGQGGVNVWLFDDDSCSGNIVTGATPIAGGVAGSWTALKGKLWIPG